MYSMNVEKTFIQKLSATHPGCTEAIYSLLENDSLGLESMQKFLIRTEFKEIITKGGRIQKMIVYSELAEKYGTSINKVRYCLR